MVTMEKKNLQILPVIGGNILDEIKIDPFKIDSISLNFMFR